MPDVVGDGGGGELEFVPGRGTESGPLSPSGLDIGPEWKGSGFPHQVSAGDVGSASDLAPGPVRGGEAHGPTARPDRTWSQGHWRPAQRRRIAGPVAALDEVALGQRLLIVV